MGLGMAREALRRDTTDPQRIAKPLLTCGDERDVLDSRLELTHVGIFRYRHGNRLFESLNEDLHLSKHTRWLKHAYLRVEPNLEFTFVPLESRTTI